MKNLLEEVLDLQPLHSSLNTPEMERRGLLIRNQIPDWLRSMQPMLQGDFGGFRGRLAVQGKDGTGPKSHVPWVRVYTPELSPSAQVGWYVVYLFKPDGEGVALCVSHESTRWDGSSFKPRSAVEADGLMSWSRQIIGERASLFGMSPGVNLGSHEGLARAYETTTVFSKMYQRDAIPEPEALAQDCRAAIDLLGELYRATEQGKAPFSVPPEVAEAIAVTEKISRPTSKPVSTGQGRGLTADERALVEDHAMGRAQEWLLDQGYDVKDVHRSSSCDFVASKNDEDFVVEVKGTTGALGSVLLTSNEVALHRAQFPLNMLVVVHGIELLDVRQKAFGGTLKVLSPWDLDKTRLVPISYQCFLAP